MDVFEESYERFHEKILASRKHLNGNKLKNAQKSISECEKQIKNMERESRHSEGVERRRFMVKLKKAKSDLQNIKQEYQQRAVGGASPSRSGNTEAELFGKSNKGRSNQSFNAMSGSNQTRARILENSSTQKETDDLLLDSQRIANETREIGTAALNSIEDQTDMLIEAKESVNQTHVETKRAGQLLNTMSRRVLTNKLFLACVILLLLGINILIIYFYHNHSPKTPGPATKSPAPATSTTVSLHQKLPKLKHVLPPQHLHHNTEASTPLKASLIPTMAKNTAHSLKEMVGNVKSGNSEQMETEIALKVSKKLQKMNNNNDVEELAVQFKKDLKDDLNRLKVKQNTVQAADALSSKIEQDIQHKGSPTALLSTTSTLLRKRL